jgi:hypothetical protein
MRSKKNVRQLQSLISKNRIGSNVHRLDSRQHSDILLEAYNSINEISTENIDTENTRKEYYRTTRESELDNYGSRQNLKVTSQRS